MVSWHVDAGFGVGVETGLRVGVGFGVEVDVEVGTDLFAQRSRRLIMPLTQRYGVSHSGTRTFSPGRESNPCITQLVHVP